MAAARFEDTLRARRVHGDAVYAGQVFIAAEERDALADAIEAAREFAEYGTLYRHNALVAALARLDGADESCLDCGGRGEIILNPDWPSGDLPHSEKCSTCSGMARLDGT